MSSHGLFGIGLFNDGYLFSSPATAIGVLTFVGMWQWSPFHTLIYQGGARAIPEVLYQAASIDGAGRIRQFFYITLPQLRNTMITSMVLMLVGGLTTFDSILILTAGGPGTGTTSTSYYMYVEAFKSFQFGDASVIAVLLIVVTTIVSLIAVRASGWDKMRSTQEEPVTKQRPYYAAGVFTRLWLLIVIAPVYVLVKASLQDKEDYTLSGPLSLPQAPDDQQLLAGRSQAASCTSSWSPGS